jgi:hypothetical protein
MDLRADPVKVTKSETYKGGNMGPLWTSEEKEVLKKMAEANKTMDEIQSVLVSRPRHGIRNQLKNMGLSIGPKPEINMEAFKKLMKGGK